MGSPLSDHRPLLISIDTRVVVCPAPALAPLLDWSSCIPSLVESPPLYCVTTLNHDLVSMQTSRTAAADPMRMELIMDLIAAGCLLSGVMEGIAIYAPILTPAVL